MTFHVIRSHTVPFARTYNFSASLYYAQFLHLRPGYIAFCHRHFVADFIEICPRSRREVLTYLLQVQTQDSEITIELYSSENFVEQPGGNK